METGAPPGGIWGLTLVIVVIVSWILSAASLAVVVWALLKSARCRAPLRQWRNRSRDLPTDVDRSPRPGRTETAKASKARRNPWNGRRSPCCLKSLWDGAARHHSAKVAQRGLWPGGIGGTLERPAHGRWTRRQHPDAVPRCLSGLSGGQHRSGGTPVLHHGSLRRDVNLRQGEVIYELESVEA